jgi:hypothetical protein
MDLGNKSGYDTKKTSTKGKNSQVGTYQTTGFYTAKETVTIKRQPTEWEKTTCKPYI